MSTNELCLSRPSAFSWCRIQIQHYWWWIQIRICIQNQRHHVLIWPSWELNAKKHKWNKLSILQFKQRTIFCNFFGFYEHPNSGSPIGVITLEPCNTCRELHCGPHIKIIQTIQDEYYSLSGYILNFQLNKNDSYRPIEHMTEMWLILYQRRCHCFSLHPHLS